MAGVYVHIPFCASKCIYCDFYSMPGKQASWSRYADAVLAEARMRAAELPAGSEIATLYIGGGTPSLLPAGLLQRLVGGLRQALPLDGVGEFTVEVNPDDVTPTLVQALSQMGVNRVSMGVQSFSDQVLRFIGRRHTAEQARHAVELLRQGGIANVSIDLIFGLPGATLHMWRHDLQQAVGLGVQHISVYSLMFEPGTRITAMRDNGKVAEVPEEVALEMERMAQEQLAAAGFEQYEISNFALPGYHSRHNSSYWDLTPYLGLGAAAHSFDGEVRRYNPANLRQYLSLIGQGVPAFETERLTAGERFNEYVMLRLRTAAGVDLADAQARFGQACASHIAHSAQPHLQAGNLASAGGKLRLTAAGVMLADAVTRDLML